MVYIFHVVKHIIYDMKYMFLDMERRNFCRRRMVVLFFFRIFATLYFGTVFCVMIVSLAGLLNSNDYGYAKESKEHIILVG